MKYKVLIADDDIGMRLILKKIIEKYDEFELVGEVEDGEKAILSFEKYSPDIIFMDVEMPKLNGVECAKKIFDINPKTIIIFATAHSEYMPEAFEVYAFDYIIKPFKIDRVNKTLERVKEIINDNDKNNEPLFYQKNNEKLMIKNREGINFINSDDIILIQREDRNSVIYTHRDKYFTSEGLCNLEKRLEKTRFYRSHKSYIINISKITKVSPYGRWTYIVKFNNTDLDALITHKKFEELEKLFI